MWNDLMKMYHSRGLLVKLIIIFYVFNMVEAPLLAFTGDWNGFLFDATLASLYAYLLQKWHLESADPNSH
ncbi:hypothetical protein ACFYKX_10655 [Cytobacillus sp. FJAT-54145]|uniref:Uncharacterized protein n=1 Tax=Cytobacillus spartinae TaxID=3299023 RepID=A0ABW6KDT4_9BACI